MKENSIQGKKRRRFIRTTDSNHNLTISPNLVDRKFDRQAPNQVSDITDLRTQTGWVYLEAVMDGHTRKILGWSLADHMGACNRSS